MKTITIGNPRKKNFQGKKPVIIKWQDTEMVRNQSIRSAAHELANMSSNQDLISVNVIGKQSTGKSALCETVAHLMHQFAKEDYDTNYDVTKIGRDEFIDLEETVKNLRPTNHIIIFDDLAFLKAGATSKQIEQIQYVLSVIRHLPGGEDVRIVIFKNFQYSKALPPFLRQNDATFISSVDDAEMKAMGDLVGTGNMRKIELLKRMGVQLKLGTKNNAFFDYPIGNPKKKTKFNKSDYFTYHAKNPFLPYLYWNGDSLRFVVSPLRTWMNDGKICPVCDNKEKTVQQTQSLEEFAKIFDGKYGGKTANVKKKILEVLAIKNGMNCFNGKINAGLNYVEAYMKNTGTTAKELINYFEMEEKPLHRTRQSKNRLPAVKLPIEEFDKT